MTKIKELVDKIDDELCGAKEYAEMYVELKAKNNQQWATKFRELSSMELQHASVLHDYTVQEIEELRKIYTPPVEMLEKWDKSHKKYAEKASFVKQMLAL